MSENVIMTMKLSGSPQKRSLIIIRNPARCEDMDKVFDMFATRYVVNLNKKVSGTETYYFFNCPNELRTLLHSSAEEVNPGGMIDDPNVTDIDLLEKNIQSN